MDANPGIQIQKVYVRENDEAIIVCHKCGVAKTTNVASFLHKGRIKVKCGCGNSFTVSFEKRKHYRKAVSLAGYFLRTEPFRDAGEMVVEDLSSTGLGFRTNIKSKLQVSDIVKVQFALDDKQRSKISRNAIVRNVTDRFIGAEFCDQDACRPLLFYLRT